MNSNQLKQFIAIAEEENITRASQALFMSQSALSNTLKLLEEELGCNLFDRKSNRLILNSNGTNLLGYAKKITELIEAAEQSFKTDKNQRQRVNIATSSHLYFSTFFKCSPLLIKKYHFKVVESNYNDIFDFLDRKNCDMVIAPDYPNIHKKLDRFDRVLLGKEQLWVCLPANHPFSEKQEISVRELSGEQFLAFDNDGDFRWQDFLFMKKGYSLDYFMELPRGYTRNNNDSSWIDMPSFLTSLACNSQICNKANYKFIPISDPEATRNVHLWYKAGTAELVNNLLKDFL